MPKKIFELAKDLDVNSLELVEKLRDMGFQVRNHMSALTDEEVEKVEKLLKAEEPAEAAKKPAKKTVKKKASATTTAAPKKKAVRKSTVIRKKADTDQPEEVAVSEEPKVKTVKKVAKKVAQPEEENDTIKTAESSVSQQETTSTQTLSEAFNVSPAKEEVTEKTHTTGLRVVSMPEEKVEEESSDDSDVDSDLDEVRETKKELFKEKVHKFTPVYIPKTDDPVDELDEDFKGRDKDSKTSKKRLGGLATMMSGKKPIASKSQALLEDRAENELKSYAALSSMGRPIYTQVKKKKIFSGSGDSTPITSVKESKRVVNIHKYVQAQDLAQKLSLKFQDFANQCLDLNILIKPQDYLGLKLTSEIAALWNYRVEDRAFKEEEVIGAPKLSEKEKNDLPMRSPIITIMGHVDHGKTTLLDYIREAKVADGEAGGITQHIGAYSVKARGQTLTFLDTPGHAAFAAMRQRGADVTDIVVLVVAADDGVMPQTRESINFCKQAKKPVIVAVNKMDKEGVNPDRIKQELSDFGLMPEEWGGETQYAHISALKGTGVDALLEAIALQAEMMELRASPKGKAEGVVIESKIEPGRGPVATILVQTGTLNKGDSIVVGECYGRARSLMDHTGKLLQSAGPSTPVQILGLDLAPSPGDVLYTVKNEREAKKIVDNRISERKALEATPEKKKMSLEDFFGQSAPEENETKTLSLLIRADVQGSFEAIKSSLESLKTNEVDVKVQGGGVGPITDSDVNFAKETGSFIIGFNMRPVTTARKLAEEKGLDVKTYSIIYELINDIKLAIEGMLTPDFVEEFVGRAEVRDTFTIPKIGTIAGCYVIDGKIENTCKVRLLRSGKIVFDGKLSSLKRFKDDVKEVKNGLECGMALEGFNDIKNGDIFEAYKMVEKKRTFDDAVALTASSPSNENRL